MADALLSSTVQVLVEKAISTASEQIGLFLSFKKDLEKLKESFEMIQAVLQDAERQQVTKDSVKRWLKKLERVAFDADNLLDDFNYEIIRRKVEIQNQMKRKVCFFFSLSNPIAFRLKMAHKVQEINMDLKRINQEARDFGLQSQIEAIYAPVLAPLGAFIKKGETDSGTVDSSFVGRVDDVLSIVTELTATSNNESIYVLPIVGMGGIGKTTLARKVFNDPKIKKHFEKRMWICVSDDHFGANRLLGLILESLDYRKPEAESREARFNKLKELLDGKRYLLVMDDVWNENATRWNDFLGSLKGISSAKGTCILVTTRRQQVATVTGISSSPCSLKKLSDDECWLILKENSLGTREVPNELQDIGFKIAQKCHGLPLAAAVLGGMLRNKGGDEWLSTLETKLQNLGGNETNDVIEILKLSYDHLPSPSLKECFVYCSIFPKDFKIRRNQLIQLWAAEGFLHSISRNNLKMEEVGDKFFSILLDSNLLQDVEMDNYGNILYCKMHDLVHDLVLSISESKTSRLKESERVNDNDETFPVRYLVVERSDGEEIPFFSSKSLSCVTTLVLLENKISDSLISSLTCLRVLNLASSKLQKLPESIGKLSHLRYLDSSYNPIEILPDSICKLYKLQALRVRGCKSLKKFPKNFKNLLNLRHFDFFPNNSSSDMMPLEIGQLKCLQTLLFFNIGEEKGRLLGELGSLENLSGCLEIRNLELVKNKDEAGYANLIGKSNICELSLVWNYGEEKENESKDNQVLEGLQPHRNLKGLVIKKYSGDQLPLWIPKLEKLVKLELLYCNKLNEIPTLGHLLFLGSLNLEGLDGVTSIGPSFYGGGSTRHGMGSNSSRGPIKLFPALKYLSLKSMPNLKEWTEATFHDRTMVVFPVLENVKIISCPQLVIVPSHFPSLKKLSVKGISHGSAVITKICGLSTLTDLEIEDVSGLTELPNVLFQNNPNLAKLRLGACCDLRQFLHFGSGVRTLESQNCQIVSELSQSHTNIEHLVGLWSLEELKIFRCSQLESISIPRGRQYLNAIRTLHIIDCDKLTHLSIPQIFGSDSELKLESSDTCHSLDSLSVWHCSNLISFPLVLNQTPSLSSLIVASCEKLIDLPKGELCCLASLRELKIGPFSYTTGLDSFLDLFSDLHPQHLPFLSYVSLYGWPHWESLPDQLQHLRSLRTLELYSFGVKSLPDWFDKLLSLEILRLYDCSKLENLPSHQSMTKLIKLRRLSILRCPLLEEICNRETSGSSNSEWSKISYIPYIRIDGKQIRKDGIDVLEA